jgi:cell division protein FtsW
VKQRRNTPMTFENSMLRTATLCLIALGAIMVYSASSGTSLLSHGDSFYFLKRYVASAVLGLVALSLMSRFGLEGLRRIAPTLLAVSFAGLVLVLLPGFGLEVNGARRWVGAGPLQIQPSELAKLALVLYAAGMIAARPERARSLHGARPLLLVAATMSALVVLEPDMGTAIVICLTLGAMLVVGGIKIRHLVGLVGALAILALVFSLSEPYRRARLVAFLNPWADTTGTGFQSVQAMIAIGSGGFSGVGLGESVQKLFYLPEAHTDMILAVIGEELGLAGISLVLFLYGMIAYAGLSAARKARDLHSKLVAAGITSVIVLQATINFFAVLGVLPLTGVPLPFISYGNSNLIVLLAGMGVLINIAQRGPARARSSEKAPPKRRRRQPRLKLVQGGKHGRRRETGRDAARGASADRKRSARATGPLLAIRKLADAKDRDRSRRDGRPRRAGARDRRRAAS